MATFSTFTAFTAKLLANTAGAGGLRGRAISERPGSVPDPVTFNATGYYGPSFPTIRRRIPGAKVRPLLIGYDKYTIDLYVDFAWWTALR